MAPERAVRCWPLSRWPAIDQEAWARGCAPGDPFDGVPYGTRLRPDTRRMVRKGYGRWLDFLDSRGWLDPLQPPLERLTRIRLRAYFHALRAAGNADQTVEGRFCQLTLAMRILAPGQEVAWISRFDGVPVRAALDNIRRPLPVPDSRVLFAWALDLMDTARAKPPGEEDHLAYRDGLLLAVLASRGRRLRSMALLRVGHELILEDGRYRIELAPEQVKTGKRDWFALPERLAPYIEHYLAVVRPALLKGHRHDALWVAGHGGALTAKSIQHMVGRRTLARFGQTFGPHRFRHALATTAALQDPAQIGLAAGVLGISAEIVEKHYNRADQKQAAISYDDLIERRRQALRDAAAR